MNSCKDTFLGTEKVTADENVGVNGMEDVITVYHEHGGTSKLSRRNFMKKYNSTVSQSFSTALEYLKDGEHLNRFGWENPNAYIVLGPEYSIYSEYTQKTTKIGPFIQFCGHLCKPIPWTASNEDLLSTDWRVVSKKDINIHDLVYVFNYGGGCEEDFCPYEGKVGKVVSIAKTPDARYKVKFGDDDWLFLRKELIRVGY